METLLKFPGLGLEVSTADKAKVAELAAKYPEVRRAFERINAAANQPHGKEAKGPAK